MGLFGRRRQEPPPGGDLDAVGPLWQWWSERGRALASVGGDPDPAFLEPFQALLDAVHPDLAWEVGPGVSAERGLVISAGGLPELRTLAERCVRAAPAADAEWQYLSSRQPLADWSGARLQLPGGEEADLGLATVSLHVDDDRAAVDVSVHHPAFPAMPEQVRLEIAFHLLDQILGEDAVTVWVGEVAASATEAPDALPAGALAETVAALAERTGDDTWAMAESRHRRSPVLLSARRPLSCVTHPLLDEHLLARLPYDGRAGQGLPGDEALEALRDWEDALVEALGEAGLLVALETTAGVRTFHLYGDSTDGRARATVQAAVSRWSGADLHVALDPGWSAVRRFR